MAQEPPALTAERDLQRGIDRGELQLAYQPIVNLRDGTLAGAEALLRWEHPTRGLLWPSQFLPDTTQSALRARIGRWVIQTVAAQAAHWHRRYPNQHLTIGVNVSCNHLDDADLALVLEHLHRAGLTASTLAFEIGESEFFDHIELNRRRVDAARALGLQVVLDDFGSATVVAHPEGDGHADPTRSLGTAHQDDTLVLLASLEHFPIDALKLDRNLVEQMLVEDPRDSLVAGVISLARRFGFQTIAEGVETPAEARRARRARLRSRAGLPLPPSAGARVHRRAHA